MTTDTKKKHILMTFAVDSDDSGSLGRTILFNCNCHTFHAVITQITRAIQCTQAKASRLADEAHNSGKAVIFEGNKKRCEKVADVLGSIGLKVAVEG